MNVIQFWILNILSGLVALLIGFEIYSDQELDQVTAQQQQAQAPIAQAAELRPILISLIQRLVRESAHDAELKNLLTKYGMKFPTHLDTPAASSANLPTTPLPSSQP